MASRAVLFVDGNNWFHSLKEIGLTRLGSLDYRKISLKLILTREWTETRYYIGRVRRTHTTKLKLYDDQRQFLAKLKRDQRISTHLGRLEPRSVTNEAAQELKKYLAELNPRITPACVFHELMDLANRHKESTVFVEKAVDVMLATDLVIMAERDRFDAAYLLSADGDFTPAVEHVRSLGKKVYAVSAASGARLASAVDSFIKLPATWFDDCYDEN